MTNADPIVIAAAARTIGGFQGEFKDLAAASLGAAAVKAALARSAPEERRIRANQKTRPMAVHLPGRGASRRTQPPRPFHHARRAEAQRPSNHTHALARFNPRNSPLSQIHRIGSCHFPPAFESNPTGDI
jgi:hypothetical protein